MPNVGEPPTAISRAGLSSCISRLQGSVSCDGVTITGSATEDIPPDDDTTLPAMSGSSSAPSAGATIGNYYTLGANNYIYINRVHYESVTITSGTNWTATHATDTTTFVCKYNYAQKHIYEAGGTANSSMNTDVQFIRSMEVDLIDVAGFRDPIIDVDTAEAGVSGISDNAFETYVESSPVTTDLTPLQSALTSFRNTLAAQNRTGASNGNSGKGTLISFDTPTWATYYTEVGLFGTNCGKRVTEIDTRIGVPTRAGSQSTTRGAAPAIYVSAIPAANTTGGQVPYGRALYNSCNNLLGDDLKMMTELVDSIQGLDSLIDLVKKARNKYEIFSGRAKEYS
jgi:hypothetical protein